MDVFDQYAFCFLPHSNLTSGQPTCCLTHLFEPRAGKRTARTKCRFSHLLLIAASKWVENRIVFLCARGFSQPLLSPSTPYRRCNVMRFACGTKFWTLAVIRKNRQIIGYWFGILMPEKTDCFVILFNGSSANQSQENCGGSGLGRLFLEKNMCFFLAFELSSFEHRNGPIKTLSTFNACMIMHWC